MGRQRIPERGHSKDPGPLEVVVPHGAKLPEQDLEKGTILQLAGLGPASTMLSLRTVDDERLRTSGFSARGAEEDPGRSAPRLGVGLAYNPSVAGFLRSDLDLVDYVSIVPDMFWTDRGAEAAPRFAELKSWVDTLDWVAARRPVISHDIGLSLGGAEAPEDNGYVEQLAAWHRRYSFPWHSDRLSFSQARGPHGECAGLPVPLPFDFEVLDVVSDRITRILQRLKAPFLIENGVYDITFVDQDMSEAEFLNRVAGRTGCGLLLDVNNLYANARNHGFDAAEFVDALDLSRVVEVHVAGGSELAGTYPDSHAGACPDAAWSLLEQVLPHAPNLRGVTFEFRGSYVPRLQIERLRAQLTRARAIWTNFEHAHRRA